MAKHHILNCWRDVEIFNIPAIHEDQFNPLDTTQLPWEQPTTTTSPYTRCFILYFGRIKTEQLVQAIETRLPAHNTDKADWLDPLTGHTCLAALVLDEQGRPDEKGYTQAAYVQGMYCLLHKHPVATVTDKMRSIQQDYEDRYRIPAAEQLTGKRTGDPVTATQLLQELRYLEQLTATWYEEPIQLFCAMKEVMPGNEPDTAFLNSFYLPDLNTLLLLPEHQWGAPLQQYLEQNINTAARQDILADTTAFIQTLDPALLSPGRWPSDIYNGLYSAQLGAVNTTCAALKTNGGMRGINGPPGTGKTTLLQEVIADVIVTRARKLMDTGLDKLFTGSYKTIQRAQDNFTGYYPVNTMVMGDSGIVVASNNNAAVENISKELPSFRKLDRQAFPAANYFSEITTGVLPEHGWGMLSATLGSLTNRITFCNGFWKNNKNNSNHGFHDRLHTVYRDVREDRTETYAYLYEETAEQLTRLLQEFDQFKSDAGKLFNQLPAVTRCLQLYAQWQREKNQLEDAVVRLENSTRESRRRISILSASITQVHQSITLHQLLRPRWHWLQKLFHTAGYKKWLKGTVMYHRELHQITAQKATATQDLDQLFTDLKNKRQALHEVNEELTTAAATIENFHELRLELYECYELPMQNILDYNFAAQPLHEIHLRTPWSCPRINALRSNILLKSLELHQYAILARAKEFRANLDAFFKMITGAATIKDTLAAELWNTFFFCVPVVSTTLASAARLFPAGRNGTIGWLLLDEAGQATPQSAAGIIWRAERCIAVGDPQQVAPIITIPHALVQQLRGQYPADISWLPANASVQYLADRISPLGTYLQQALSDERIWTGFPLRTHRRCQEPMFAVANEIAYDNQMVKATRDKSEDAILGPSNWCHIAGYTVTAKHVIQEELTLLREKIRTLNDAGYTENIFIITPFKAIEHACRQLFRQDNIYCGTIHLFQGKEADTVFLVLGSHPEKAGARHWASRLPNILNVAVTRARKRLYVIGNKNLWAQCPYFNVLARHLATPVDTVPQQGTTHL